MAVSKIPMGYQIRSVVCDGNTDPDGDFALPSVISSPYSIPISAHPDRLAGNDYYTSWYTILLNGSTTGLGYSAKLVDDHFQPMASKKVRFTAYYMVL